MLSFILEENELESMGDCIEFYDYDESYGYEKLSDNMESCEIKDNSENVNKEVG